VEAMPRIYRTISYPWSRGLVQHEVIATVKATRRSSGGKVWQRGQPEPKEWTVELEDPRPTGRRPGPIHLRNRRDRRRTGTEVLTQPARDANREEVKGERGRVSAPRQGSLECWKSSGRLPRPRSPGTEKEPEIECYPHLSAGCHSPSARQSRRGAESPWPT